MLSSANTSNTTLKDVYNALLLPLPSEEAGERKVLALAPLIKALPGDLTFFDNVKYSEQLQNSAASYCLVQEKNKGRLPKHMQAIISLKPAKDFITLSRILHSDDLIPKAFYASAEDFAHALIHEDAEIERGVIIEPYAVIGKNAVIGSGTIISIGAVIGEGVTIGRNSYIGPHVTIQRAHIGNHVMLHSGVKIGQDGFGYRQNEGIHEKIPQVGRVIIQDNVEIGANTTIDRGSLRDTVIGDGTKIDNHVQIAHNVTVGRNCIIIAFCGLAGSATLEDDVILAGNVSVNNHVIIGEGSQILATSAVKDNMPPNGVYGGAPAKPVREWFREITTLQKLAQQAKTLPEGKNNE